VNRLVYVLVHSLAFFVKQTHIVLRLLMHLISRSQIESERLLVVLLYPISFCRGFDVKKRKNFAFEEERD